MSTKASDFSYILPESSIAQYPLEKRDQSRMMVLPLFSKIGLIDSTVKYFTDFLLPGDVLVINSTKVISARLLGTKIPTGAKCEIFLVEKLNENQWKALVRPSRRIHGGNLIEINPQIKVEIVSREQGAFRKIRFLSEFEITQEVLFEIGNVPLPPYIKRKPNEFDKKRYQTVYASVPGAVAAPTAGLHLTREILDKVKEKGVIITELLLHVGPGTFAPLSEDLSDHKMHREYYQVNEETAKIINEAKNKRRRIIAVGTTSVRALESAVDEEGKVMSSYGWTDIFIYPPYNFRVVDGLLTNFHLPRSSLICLVSALAGRERILNAYKIALDRGYRFASYGDCMLILP
ncbi:MAG: hypothetical protein APR63_04685 [Desulfuromonas sp. SDB]|nr:MAG: hypothetical protein APR63_04685 [Desulfuromonas sp. SDB]